LYKKSLYKSGGTNKIFIHEDKKMGEIKKGRKHMYFKNQMTLMASTQNTCIKNKYV
jgi:hypothetical protein